MHFSTWHWKILSHSLTWRFPVWNTPECCLYARGTSLIGAARRKGRPKQNLTVPITTTPARDATYPLKAGQESLRAVKHRWAKQNVAKRGRLSGRLLLFSNADNHIPLAADY
jgi:hypothetical protein